MSNAVFPVLAGLAFPVAKAPIWRTINQQAASGREVNVGLMSYPLYEFTLTYDVLRSSIINGSTFTELQTLLDFYNARNAMRDDFLFDDLDDDTATNQLFAVADGATVAYQLGRSLILGGFLEPTMNIKAVTAIMANGVVQNVGNYSVGSTGIVTFNSAPALNANLTWNGSYYFRCRFNADTQEFSKFMTSRFEVRSMKLIGSLGLKI